METEGTGPVAELRDRLQAALRKSYTLERELGGGGMSRVFVATDARLGRHVVVKVLHPDLAAGLSAQRFEREVRLAARLQHPHIAPLLTAADLDGLPFYTMPFVEGETLRDRLAREGALPVGDTLRLLRELADALAYAHDHGVVHRDLKPANVLLSGGHAVVVDFGVAKALATATVPGADAAASSAEPGTALGVAVGTPAYMAPEQAAADPATDHRADLYALGVIAYEALAGAHPFAGRPPHAMLTAHLTESPTPLAERRPDVPGQVAALVMRLLEKRPDNRPASATDVMRALDDLTTPAGGVMPPPPPNRSTWVFAAVAFAMLFVIMGAAAFLWRARPEPAPSHSALRDHPLITSRQLTFTGEAEEPEFSRDGRHIAYVERQCVPGGTRDGATDSTCTVTLKVRDVASGQSTTVLTEQRVKHPHWSADGAWIVVLMAPSDGEYRDSLGTYLVGRFDGTRRRLAPPALAEFGAHGDTLLIAAAAAPGASRFLRRVYTATATTLDSTPLPSALTDLQGFHASPDGRWLALRLWDRVLLATPDRSPTDTLMFRNAGSLRWDPRGDALYAVVPGSGVDAWLLRVRVDPQHGRFVSGLDTVRNLGPSAKWTFDVAPDGETIVRTGGTVTTTQWTLNRDARPAIPRSLPASTSWLGTPYLSSDGQLVGYEKTDQAGLNVYVQQFAGEQEHSLTHDSAGWAVAGWLPGTHRLLYTGIGPTDSLYAQDVAGGPRQVVGPPNSTPLATGGSVALDSTGRKVVFRSAAGVLESVVALPDTLDGIMGLGDADADGGGVLALMNQAPAGALPHPRIVHVARSSGKLEKVVDLRGSQEVAVLKAGHGEVIYATWAVGQEVGHPTVWRGGPGRSPKSGERLSLKCEAGSLSMSADGRRFACVETTRRPDLFLEPLGRSSR